MYTKINVHRNMIIVHTLQGVKNLSNKKGSNMKTWRLLEVAVASDKVIGCDVGERSVTFCLFVVFLSFQLEVAAGGDKVIGCDVGLGEVWQTPLIWAQGSSNLHHNTTHKVSFTAQLQKTPFLLHTPKVCFKRSFTSCISVRRVYFVACVCPQQTVGS